MHRLFLSLRLYQNGNGICDERNFSADCQSSSMGIVILFTSQKGYRIVEQALGSRGWKYHHLLCYGWMCSQNLSWMGQAHRMGDISVLSAWECCDNLLINSVDGKRNSSDGTSFSNWHMCSKFNWLLCLLSCHITLTMLWSPFLLIKEEKTETAEIVSMLKIPMEVFSNHTLHHSFGYINATLAGSIG